MLIKVLAKTEVALECENVRIEAGYFKLDMNLNVRNKYYHGGRNYHINSAADPKISWLSDDYLIINFTRVKENLLRGIQYSPIIYKD